MKHRYNFLSLISAAVLLFVVTIPAFAVEAPPTSYVEDRAGIIDAQTKAELLSRLKTLDEKTGIQMVVLTVPTTDGIPIEEYSIERAQKWGIGQKGKDNGILFVIATNDKKYRIEVGYGLESVIPDSLAGTIGRQYMVPKFKQGDFSGGVNDAANAVIGTVAKAYGTEVEGAAPAVPLERSKKKSRLSTLITLFFFIVVLSSFFTSFRRRGLSRRSGGMWIGTGGFGGGGFGGGGSGGFGGFGGGGFGGGGASGGW